MRGARACGGALAVGVRRALHRDGRDEKRRGEVAQSERRDVRRRVHVRDVDHAPRPDGDAGERGAVRSQRGLGLGAWVGRFGGSRSVRGRALGDGRVGSIDKDRRCASGRTRRAAHLPRSSRSPGGPSRAVPRAPCRQDTQSRRGRPRPPPPWPWRLSCTNQCVGGGVRRGTPVWICWYRSNFSSSHRQTVCTFATFDFSFKALTEPQVSSDRTAPMVHSPRRLATGKPDHSHDTRAIL